MTKSKGKECPCIAWLAAYDRLGNYEFYHGGEWKKHTICMPCQLHIDGHSDWCEFCQGTGKVKE